MVDVYSFHRIGRDAFRLLAACWVDVAVVVVVVVVVERRFLVWTEVSPGLVTIVR